MGEKRLRGIWHHMRNRCESKKDNRYHIYGARGIRVCDEWRNNYAAFREWSKMNGYNDALSIDRIDSNGNYTPENCRWATPKQQANNRRNNRRITFQGEEHTLEEWSRRIGITSNALWLRLYHGWPVEKALTKGARHDRNRKTDIKLDFRAGSGEAIRGQGIQTEAEPERKQIFSRAM